MKLTDQQMFDYMNCPAYFDIKWGKGIAVEETVSTSKLLEKISKFFYLNLFNQRLLTTHELKKKWDSLCTQHADYMDQKKCIEGMGSILKFYQWAHGEQLIPIDVDTPFKVVVNGFEIGGQLGTILATAGEKYELIITDFSSKAIDTWLIDMKLAITLHAYAFHRMYNRGLDGIRVRSVKYAKDFYTTRNDDDFLRLEKTIDSVGRGITEGIYYPRESFMCLSCPAKQYCKGWY